MTPNPLVRHITAQLDPRLSARVMRTTPLRYADGADDTLDRPAHVRAGSGLAWWGERLAVVQDDAGFVGLIDPRDARVTAITLPAGPGGRRQFDDALGNKADKLDLECVVRVPSRDDTRLLVALGSGSTARRESVVTICASGESAEPTVAVHHVPALYAALRAAEAFAGSELNVEGATYVDGPSGARLRLFNRGNGAPRGERIPIDATCDLDWDALAAHLEHPSTAPPPLPLDIVQYDLGAVGGLALTFTDAASVHVPGDGSARLTLYTAAAEASPDATRDGPVSGCAIGVLTELPNGTSARWAPLHDVAGRPYPAKIEGIAVSTEDPMLVYVVVDRDAHDVPSDLCEVVLEGPWFA